MSTNKNRAVAVFEEMIEKGQSSLKKSTTNTVSDFAKTTKGQVTGGSGKAPNQDQGTNEVGSNSQNSDQPQMTDEQRVEFLSDLYGKGNSKSANNDSSDGQKSQKGTGDVKQALGVPVKDPYEGKTPEEIAKIEALRRQLHSDYYQELIRKAKTKDEPVAEKLEREEQEEKMAELEEENKKPKELPKTVKQGTAETAIGVAG